MRGVCRYLRTPHDCICTYLLLFYYLVTSVAIFLFQDWKKPKQKHFSNLNWVNNLDSLELIRSEFTGNVYGVLFSFYAKGLGNLTRDTFHIRITLSLSRSSEDDLYLSQLFNLKLIFSHHLVGIVKFNKSRAVIFCEYSVSLYEPLMQINTWPRFRRFIKIYILVSNITLNNIFIRDTALWYIHHNFIMHNFMVAISVLQKTFEDGSMGIEAIKSLSVVSITLSFILVDTNKQSVGYKTNA